MTTQLPAPFFIVGCSRSGTTLLQTLIDAHPNLAIPPESQIYERFSRVFHTYGDFAKPGNRRRFIQDLLKDAYIRQWQLKASVEEVEAAVTAPTRVAVIEALFKLYAQRKGAARWGDKTPEHVRYLPLIRRDFPNAPLIHLVRDGRDTAEALRRMTWAPVTILGLAREWRREVLHWKDFCDRAGDERTLVVRYENLVSEPAAVVKAILDFIEEPFIDTTRSYAGTQLSKTLGAQTGWHSSLLRGINSAKAGVYRQKFTTREIEIFEQVAGDALLVYGYPLDTRNPRGPDIWDRLSAPVVDRLVRWYRKLFLPQAFAWDIQLRLRTLRRRLLGSRAAP